MRSHRLALMAGLTSAILAASPVMAAARLVNASCVITGSGTKTYTASVQLSGTDFVHSAPSVAFGTRFGFGTTYQMSGGGWSGSTPTGTWTKAVTSASSWTVAQINSYTTDGTLVTKQVACK